MHQPNSTAKTTPAQEKTAVPLKLRTDVRAGQSLGASDAGAEVGCNPLDPRGCKPKTANAAAGCSPWDPRCNK